MIVTTFALWLDKANAFPQFILININKLVKNEFFFIGFLSIMFELVLLILKSKDTIQLKKKF